MGIATLPAGTAARYAISASACSGGLGIVRPFARPRRRLTMRRGWSGGDAARRQGSRATPAAAHQPRRLRASLQRHAAVSAFSDMRDPFDVGIEASEAAPGQWTGVHY
ncbi:MAG TPA: hypothetical protein VFK10_19125 [Burkholderiaceae bacterium]|nr:hypothetical protein [Burkholderiaceae bacterium]